MGCAFVMGTLIGIERQYRQRNAGLRTNILVSIGAAAFTVLSCDMTIGNGDPSRVAAQIVSGIGFLGAGVIFVKDDLIQGLTTAAGMWTTSGIAACIGAGLIFIGVFATLFLVVLQKIFHYPFFNQIDHPNVLIQTNIVSKNDEIYKIFEKYGIEVNEIKIDRNLDQCH